MNNSVAKWSMNFGKYAVAIILFLFCIFPLLWIVSSSLKGSSEIMATPPTWIPVHATLDNYLNAIQKNNLLVYLKNSFIITLGSTVLTIVVSAFAAYGLTFFKFKGSKVFTAILVAMQMLPVVITIVALFVIFKFMGILGTPISLILAYSASTWGIPVAIIMLSAYFSEVPKEIAESARIDGCSGIGIFFRMILPLSVPGLLSTTIYNFVMVWQEFMLAVSLISKKSMYTLPVGLKDFEGMYSTDWGGIMATSVVIAIPSVILFVSIQNYFMNNLAGAVKG
jgi:multiple sugar transport system permease protein